MNFGMVDRIVELTRGERIVAVRAVTLAEEYLADHFPKFPVLPGVLMLEAMVEAASWLVRDALDFAPSVILLRRAKNVKYKGFVRPGNLLTVAVTCSRLAQGESDFSGVGTCNQEEVVRAKFSLTHFSLGEREESPDRLTETDRCLVQAAKARFARLGR